MRIILVGYVKRFALPTAGVYYCKRIKCFNRRKLFNRVFFYENNYSTFFHDVYAFELLRIYTHYIRDSNEN